MTQNNFLQQAVFLILLLLINYSLSAHLCWACPISSDIKSFHRELVEIDGLMIEVESPASPVFHFYDGTTQPNPLGIYTGPSNLSARAAGWVPQSKITSSEFAAAMNIAVEKVAVQIQQNLITEAKDALKQIAKTRKEIEGSTDHGVLRDAAWDQMFTRIDGPYRVFLEEALKKVKVGKDKRPVQFIQKGIIPGNPPIEIELTRIRTPEFVMENYDKMPGLWKDSLIAHSGPYWRHTDIDKIDTIMSHVQGMFARAISKSTTQAQTIELAAKIHWWLANAAPYKRGSASIADAFVKSILNAKGIRPGPWAEGIMVDIKSFHLSEEEFVACYKKHCGPPCPDLQCFFE